MLIALTCFNNTWLQMRVNTGYIFYAGWVVLTVLLGIILRKREPGLRFSLINLVICTVYSIFLYGWKRLQIVPASIIREGIHQGTIKFSVINTAVFVFIVLGMAIILLDAIKQKNN